MSVKDLAVGQVEGLQRRQLVGPRRDDLLAVGPAQRAHQRIGIDQGRATNRRSVAVASHGGSEPDASALAGAVPVISQTASMNCSAVSRLTAGPRKT